MLMDAFEVAASTSCSLAFMVMSDASDTARAATESTIQLAAKILRPILEVLTIPSFLQAYWIENTVTAHNAIQSKAAATMARLRKERSERDNDAASNIEKMVSAAVTNQATRPITVRSGLRYRNMLMPARTANVEKRMNDISIVEIRRNLVGQGEEPRPM